MEMRLHLLGRIGYDEAHALQRRLVEERAIGAGIDTLLALEHDPVLTLGRNASAQHLHLSEAEYAARGIAAAPRFQHRLIRSRASVSRKWTI